MLSNNRHPRQCAKRRGNRARRCTQSARDARMRLANRFEIGDDMFFHGNKKPRALQARGEERRSCSFLSYATRPRPGRRLIIIMPIIKARAMWTNVVIANSVSTTSLPSHGKNSEIGHSILLFFFGLAAATRARRVESHGDR